jgi:hypothetical protein
MLSFTLFAVVFQELFVVSPQSICTCGSPEKVFRSGAKHGAAVQYLLLVFTIFEVLEGPIHGGDELELPNCNKRHHEPCKNIVQHRDICCCNDSSSSILSAAMVGMHWAPLLVAQKARW